MNCLRSLLLVGCMLFLQQTVSAQATQPTDDAVSLYLKAGKLVSDKYAINIMAPSASNMEYPPYPPFSTEWMTMEKVDFAANAPARELAHQARSIEHANWPANAYPKPGVSYLNGCRALANDLADAALYQNLQGNDAAAIETIKDSLHLADLLQNQPNTKLVHFLVSVGIQASSMDRLNLITSSAVFTKDPNNSNELQVSIARELIDRLLKHQDATSIVNDAVRADGAKSPASGNSYAEKLQRVVERVYADRDMAAISLACHLYRFDTGSWPLSPGDLHSYIPVIPIDTFGDGKQTLGYVLIKHGLPDGSDRPLVYSRERSKDGLFIRIDQPFYSFYNGDGSTTPRDQQKEGGQFRDVASWAPIAGKQAAATTQPLE